jgi:hypothetical protein
MPSDSPWVLSRMVGRVSDALNGYQEGGIASLSESRVKTILIRPGSLTSLYEL